MMLHEENEAIPSIIRGGFIASRPGSLDYLFCHPLLGMTEVPRPMALRQGQERLRL